MPIEDSSKPWSEEESPYVPVARLKVPAQDAWDEAISPRLDDTVAFSPWHGLAAHQPLGSIMRVRKAVYEGSANFRRSHNGCPLHAPPSLSEAA